MSSIDVFACSGSTEIFDWEERAETKDESFPPDPLLSVVQERIVGGSQRLPEKRFREVRVLNEEADELDRGLVGKTEAEEVRRQSAKDGYRKERDLQNRMKDWHSEMQLFDGKEDPRKPVKRARRGPKKALTASERRAMFLAQGKQKTRRRCKTGK